MCPCRRHHPTMSARAQNYRHRTVIDVFTGLRIQFPNARLLNSCDPEVHCFAARNFTHFDDWNFHIMIYDMSPLPCGLRFDPRLSELSLWNIHKVRKNFQKNCNFIYDRVCCFFYIQNVRMENGLGKFRRSKVWMCRPVVIWKGRGKISGRGSAM